MRGFVKVLPGKPALAGEIVLSLYRLRAPFLRNVLCGGAAAGLHGALSKVNSRPHARRMLSLLCGLLYGACSSAWRLFEHHLLIGRLLRAFPRHVSHRERDTRVSMV